MGKVNVAVKSEKVSTHEGGSAQKVSHLAELKRTVLTCLLFEGTFYEGGDSIADRIADLIKKVDAGKVAQLAIEARQKMNLRQVPLFMVRELCRYKGNGKLVAKTLPEVIQRADELAEFLAIYWKNGKESLSAGAKKGLANAFCKFNAYQIAKYNRDSVVKLRDVMFLVHPKPGTDELVSLFKKLADETLESPDTWEVELSKGKNKKEVFERLLKEKKLGGLATLRNLRNMEEAGVDRSLIRERLSDGIAKALPFRFISAARYAPKLESDIESAMLKAVEEIELFKGKTGLLIDVSGSMDRTISDKSEMTRIDAASALAILLREKGQEVFVATFSETVVDLPSRRGFALRDAIERSQQHGGTYLKAAMKFLSENSDWSQLDRVIVVTDEQSADGIYPAWTEKAYVVNVAPYKYGVSYGQGWTNINGWSERVIDYIREVEIHR